MPEISSGRRILLSVISGVLLAISYPPGPLWIVAWISLVPFFGAFSRSTSPKEALKIGYVFGVALNLASFHWLIHLPVPLWVSMLGYTALSLFSALYPALFSWAAFRIKARFRLPLIFVLPVVWVGMEFVRSIGILGFPWLDLGYTQCLNLPLIQIASITGHGGVSFLVVLLNAAILAAVFHKETGADGRRALLQPVAVLAVVLAAYFWGGHTVNEYDSSREKLVDIVMIQGNLSPLDKWQNSERLSKYMVFQDETEKAVSGDRSQPDLVIWPETAAPCYLVDEWKYRELVTSLAKRTGIPILSGTLMMDLGKSKKHFNGMALFLPDGTVGGKYKKMHLVPFGEMIPLEDKIPILEKVELGQGDYSPGSEYILFKAGDYSFGGVICFESLFPDHFRRFVSLGASFMVVVTNDAWFGRSSAPYHHSAISSFRAVENCVSIARCANTGVSALIDPCGRAVDSTGLFVRETITGTLYSSGNRDDEQTFFNRHGRIIEIVSAGISAILLLVSLFSGPLRPQGKK